MKRWTRQLMLFLLALTLPLRGFAAVSSCNEPAQQRNGGPAWHKAETGAARALQHAHGSPFHDSRDAGYPDKAATVCGDYSTCCIGTLSDSYPDAGFAAKSGASEVIAFLDRTYSGHIPEGPERPPRLLAH